MIQAKQGFSLIELMIVIMIIGVLAAAALGGLSYLRQARVKATETKLRMLDTLLDQYNNTIGEFPTELKELIEGPSKPQLQRRWQEPLASDADLEDSWKQPFIYTLNPKGSRPPYELYSIGSKGESKILSPRSIE